MTHEQLIKAIRWVVKDMNQGQTRPIHQVRLKGQRIDKRGLRVIKAQSYTPTEFPQAVPYGWDSAPAGPLVAVQIDTSVKGESAVVGYYTKHNIAEAGETRIYSTDAAGSTVKFAIHLKNDGICEIGGNTDFMVRYSALETAFNELKSDLNALVTKFNTHQHATAATGSPSTPSVGGTPISADPTTADISPAKIQEIKTI